MLVSFVQLPWLPLPPEDFTARCRALRSGEGPAGTEAQYLAGFRLDATQSGSISRAIGRRAAAGHDLAPLAPFRLGLLSSATIDLLSDCIPAAAARHGTAVELVTTPYDQVMQQALDPGSTINASTLDAVLVAVDHRWLQIDRPSLAGKQTDRVANAIERLAAVVANLRQHSRAPAILQTLPVPPHTLFGSYERRVRGTVRSMIEEANQRIVELAEQTGSYLLDAAALADRIGTEKWFDQVQWGAYKLAFAAEIGPCYADVIGRLLGAIRGKARKCLVLDLDNTVWGGAVGDAGVEGIRIGHGSATGEAFLGVQHVALDLRERGIILAVSSKNADENARGPFREHADMALRESHISVFQANWLDKASNLEAIARTLKIGLDALVLLDDNPVERAQVRAALPMVAVPELPDDPSWFPAYLLAAGYFEAVAFSDEDLTRIQSYASDAERAEVFSKARDIGDYLTSLGMVMTVMPFDLRGRQRIAQLINKTNQFNLTTRRYTEADVAAFEADPDTFTMQIRLEDKFSDLGMIAVVICRTLDSTTWDIDTWLMSCRVLGRNVEEAMLSILVSNARAHGITRIKGTYIPTAKNNMVADHYAKLGFLLLEHSADGRRVFELATDELIAPSVPIRIVTSGNVTAIAAE